MILRWNLKISDWLYDESGLLDDFDNVFLPGNSRNASWISLKKGDKWTDYTWHHHENGKTMMFVERKAHSSITHTGGATIIDNEVTEKLKDFSKIFPDPVFQ